MEQMGLVEFHHHEGNRKNVYTYLTTKGKRLRTKLAPVAGEINAIALAGMSDRDVAPLRQFMLNMISNLQAAYEGEDE